MKTTIRKELEKVKLRADEPEGGTCGTCCYCGYRLAVEVGCEYSEDGKHCNHWWDGPDAE